MREPCEALTSAFPDRRLSSFSHLGSRSLLACGCSWWRTKIRMARLLKRALEEEGHAVDVAADGRGRPVAGHRERLRGDRPGRHAARLRRIRAVPAAPGDGHMGAGADADRDGTAWETGSAGWTPARTTTSSSRSACWNSPPGCGPSPGAMTGRRPVVLAEGDLKLDPAAKRAWRADDRTAAVPEGVRPARAVPPASRRRACPLADHRGRLGLRLRRRLERRRPVRELPAAQGRHAVRPDMTSRRSGAWATGSATREGRG